VRTGLSAVAAVVAAVGVVGEAVPKLDMGSEGFQFDNEPADVANNDQEFILRKKATVLKCVALPS
jgi:hypothetical protein